MKRLIPILTLLILSTAVFAWAQPMWSGRGMGPGYSRGHMMGYGPGYPYGIDEDTQKAFESCRNDYYIKINPLRNKLWIKFSELDSLIYSENPDKKKVDKVMDDINDLRAELLDKSVEYKMETYKKTGIVCSPGGGPGGGPGRMMYGPGWQRYGWDEYDYTE